MAVYDRGEPSSSRVEINGGNVMNYIQLMPGDIYDAVAGEGSGPCAGIDIAPDDTGRCDAIQLVEDPYLAQVAGVDDVVTSLIALGISGRSSPRVSARTAIVIMALPAYGQASLPMSATISRSASSEEWKCSPLSAGEKDKSRIVISSLVSH